MKKSTLLSTHHELTRNDLNPSSYISRCNLTYLIPTQNLVMFLLYTILYCFLDIKLQIASNDLNIRIDPDTNTIIMKKMGKRREYKFYLISTICMKSTSVSRIYLDLILINSNIVFGSAKTCIDGFKSNKTLNSTQTVNKLPYKTKHIQL